MTPKTFRRIALSLPEATEGSHFSNADFRIAGKIFATLALEHQGYGVLLLTPDQQAGMVQDAPEIFSPVPGGWGEKGATRVTLAKVPADILKAALRVAWSRKAPKRLLTCSASGECLCPVATTTPYSSWAFRLKWHRHSLACAAPSAVALEASHTHAHPTSPQPDQPRILQAL